MTYEIDVQSVQSGIIASVRRRVTWAEIGQVILPMFDEVYSFLNASALGGRGHNVALYHGANRDGAELEAGVQLAAPFAATGNVACSSTPAGRVVHTVHFGEYHLLGPAHEALIHWLEQHGEKIGPGWEVYGDWHDDPSQRRTDVFRSIG